MIKHDKELLTIIRKSMEYCYDCIIFKDNVRYRFENFANCDEVAKFYNDILKNWHFNIQDDGIIFDIIKYTYPGNTTYNIEIYTRQYRREIFRNKFNIAVDHIILKKGDKLTKDMFISYKPTYKESPNCNFIYKIEKGYFDR